jgi:adenylate kinase
MAGKKLIFIGPQGSGKGTQAKIIAKELNLCHISTGDLLRNTKGELKKQVDQIIKAGNLVPDNLMLKILKQKLNSKECKGGFILDGFPRNIEQAKALDKITKIDKIIEIYISDSNAIKRISNRLSCKNCGAVFNTLTNPPKKAGICDFCSGELFKRTDDTVEAIKKRLEIYHKNTEPILRHYKSIRIDGAQDINKVAEEILQALED